MTRTNGNSTTGLFGYRYEYKKMQQNVHLSLAPGAAEPAGLVHVWAGG